MRLSERFCHWGSAPDGHTGRTCARGLGGDSRLLCARCLPSPPASGLQVEYLYSLVYQALDFISGKR